MEIVIIVIVCFILIIPCIVDCVVNKLNPTPKMNDRKNEERIIAHKIIKTRRMYETNKK